MESFEKPKHLQQVTQLDNYLVQEGFDANDTDAVIEAARFLFGESHPEHEVEEIVHEFQQDQASRDA